MKMALLAALALSGTAFAQDAMGGQQPNPPAPPEATAPEPAPPPAAEQPMSPPAEPTPVPPDNSAPQPDAQGTPVISNPAEAPAGYNQSPQVGGTGVPADARPTPQPATQNYPRCSRTVTDNCIQSEGRRRPRR